MPIGPSSITARSETTYEYWQFFAQLHYFLVRSRHDVTTRAKEPLIPSTRQFLAISDSMNAIAVALQTLPDVQVQCEPWPERRDDVIFTNPPPRLGSPPLTFDVITSFYAVDD